MIILILRASVQFFSLMLNRQIMTSCQLQICRKFRAPAVCLYGLSLRFSFNFICIYTNGFLNVSHLRIFLTIIIVMKIITYLKELFMLSYYISISYFSDNLIQISDKCVKWSLVLIRLSLSIVDGYDGICVGES